MKKTVCIIMCTLLAMAYSAGTQAQNVWDGSVAGSFAGGSGTAEDPYRIADGAQLAKLAQDVNGGNNYAGTYFVLTADIVLNDTEGWESWNESTAPANTWTPIGNSSQPFTGTLDGDGHSVSGIYINSTADYQGLVGVLGEGGTLQNLGVKASYIKGGNFVGGLCGLNDYGTVTNCYNNGSVEGNEIVGGLCGTNYGGTVTNCYNTGNVTGNDAHVGGLCGTNYSTVTNCYNTGNVTGTGDYLGGLCGWNSSGTVTNCYNTGSVSGNRFVGGVCGENSGPVTNCYNTGSVTGNDYVGGVCGQNTMGTVTNCYYLTGTANSGIGEDYNSGEATEKTADEFASGEVAWLLQNGQADQVWGQTIGTDEYPVLGGEKVLQIGNGYVNELKQDGDGFYLISTADELRLFASMVNGGQTSINGRLTADILLNDTEGWENWNETTAPTNSWTPIGSSSQPFTGTFDGQGHTVSGIYVNSGNNCQGFFGVINGATIANLHTAQGYILGNGSVGGIVGNAKGGSIEDCTNGCTIASTGSSNGGIVGNGMGVQITGCTNNGPLVAGQYQNGGIAGTVENSTIDQCVNNADITVADHAGGIAGYNTNGTVSNCLNKGNVSTSNAYYTYTAGIVANNRGTGSVVKNCLNLGTISGQNGTGCRQNSIVCAIDSDGSTGNGTPADNCYSINTSGVSVGLADNSHDVTEEELESGIIANLLQGNQEELIWGQTIGADNSPVLGGPEVFIYGDGTCGNDQLQTGESGFYLISNADELRRFADMVNSGQTSINGKLTADILLNDTEDWENWNESTEGLNSWTPIGNNSQPFTGTLDGDGHSVSGIYINSGTDYQGLVGFLGSGGTLQNVGVKTSYIKGGYTVGGLCGRNNGTVTNCYNTGTVTGTGDYAGGLCGYNNSGTVTNCYNTGSVSGNRFVGGLCGDNSGNVTNCYNTGTVTGTGDYVGGLCGTNSSPVTNCYNTGSVTGTERVGGVCGYNYGDTVTNCYNTGSVTGSNDVGGVCGRNDGGTVTNCYNTGSVEGSNYIGGLCGLNGATVTNCYYLDTCGAAGEGTPKTADQFKSGAVAYLLQNGQAEQVWGQAIGTDNSPVWQTEGNKVYKLTLQNGEEVNALYANSGNFTLPTPAEVTGYTFAGWFTYQTDGEQMTDNATLTADLTLYPQWTANSYTVTFEANGGEGSMNQQTFTYDAAQALNQNTFTRTGYSFTGWNTQADGNGLLYEDEAEVLNLTAEADGNITLYAQWSINSYTIRFVNADGTVLQSSEVGYGQMPAYNGETPTKESTAEFDYTFAGWTPGIATVTGNATYTATYTETRRSYTVTFVDEDGTTVLQSSEVEYGQMPTYDAEIPTKESTAEFDYAFAGWTPDIAIVTGEATYTATYTETRRSYTVTFVDEDGTTVLQSSEVEYGQMPTYDAEIPTKESTAEFDYAFAGWTPGIAIVTGNATYKATYTATKRSYTITFVDEDGTTVLQSSMVEYGQTPVYSGETPTKESTAEFDYAFAGWTPDIDIVTGDATYTATYTATRRSYTITFVDEDGTTVLQSSEVEYGQTPVYSGETPTKESTAEFDYAFAGWTPEIALVTGNATYTATYTATRRSYTVTLALADGCKEMGKVVIAPAAEGNRYEYGTQVTLTATANEGYTFVQWSDGDTNATRTITVTGDLTLTATFAATDPTALPATEAGAWKVIGTDGMLRITGTAAEAAVYDMRGAAVYRGTARTLHVTAGAYIVRIGNEVQKAVVK